MRPGRFLIVLLLAYLAVFLQAGFDAPRVWLNGQVNLVPPLMVYTALRLNLTCVTTLAIVAGLWLDALSANPLGVSIAPLFLAGFVLLLQREVLLQELRRLHEQRQARFSDKRSLLADLETRLRLLGPEQVLARGYSITMDAASGRVLRDAADVTGGQRVKTRLKKGKFCSRAEERDY